MRYPTLLIALACLAACNGKPAQEERTTFKVDPPQATSDNVDSAALPMLQAQTDSIATMPGHTFRRTRISIFNLLPKTPPARFTLPAGLATDTILRTPLGTQVRVAANSLQTRTNRPYSGPVIITISDYPTASSAALAGLTTETTDGKMLRTRGMAFIKATGTGGQALQLKPGSSIGLRFSGPIPSGYSAYQGQPDGPNYKWKLSSKATKATQADPAPEPEPEHFRVGDVEMQMPTQNVLTIAEQMPEPPIDVQQYLTDNLFYTHEALRARIEGQVLVNFVVDKEGAILEPVIAQGLDAGLNRIALRLVALMPRWKPGKQAGKPVAVRMSVPVQFTIRKGMPVREGRIEIPNNSWRHVPYTSASKSATAAQGFTNFAELGYCNIDQLMKQPEGAMPLWVEVHPRMNQGKGLTAILIAKKQNASVSRDFAPGQTRLQFPSLSPQNLTLLVFSADAKGHITFAHTQGRPGQTLNVETFVPATAQALDSLRKLL